MGVEQSIHVRQGGVNSLFERALLDALREAAEESQVPSEQFEHAWDPEDCSPKFRVLRDRLTARRLPSPLTTDAIRGMFTIQEIPLPQKQFRTKRLVRTTIVSIRENEKEGGGWGMMFNNSIIHQALFSLRKLVFLVQFSELFFFELV